MLSFDDERWKKRLGGCRTEFDPRPSLKNLESSVYVEGINPRATILARRSKPAVFASHGDPSGASDLTSGFPRYWFKMI
jgi:hypothetical protein